MTLARVLAVAASAAVSPPPNAPVPHSAAKFAGALVQTKEDLNGAIDAWRASGSAREPAAVTLDALYEQRLQLTLAERPTLAAAVLRQVPTPLRRELATNLAAKRELWRLTPKSHRRHFATGAALPAASLLSDYRAAQRRFGVRWTRANELELRAVASALRAMTPLMPSWLRNTGPGYLRWREEEIARGETAPAAEPARAASRGG